MVHVNGKVLRILVDHCSPRDVLLTRPWTHPTSFDFCPTRSIAYSCPVRSGIQVTGLNLGTHDCFIPRGVCGKGDSLGHSIMDPLHCKRLVAYQDPSVAFPWPQRRSRGEHLVTKTVYEPMAWSRAKKLSHMFHAQRKYLSLGFVRSRN